MSFFRETNEHAQASSKIREPLHERTLQASTAATPVRSLRGKLRSHFHAADEKELVRKVHELGRIWFGSRAAMIVSRTARELRLVFADDEGSMDCDVPHGRVPPDFFTLDARFSALQEIALPRQLLTVFLQGLGPWLVLPLHGESVAVLLAAPGLRDSALEHSVQQGTVQTIRRLRRRQRSDAGHLAMHHVMDILRQVTVRGQADVPLMFKPFCAAVNRLCGASTAVLYRLGMDGTVQVMGYVGSLPDSGTLVDEGFAVGYDGLRMWLDAPVRRRGRRMISVALDALVFAGQHWGLPKESARMEHLSPALDSLADGFVLISLVPPGEVWANQVAVEEFGLPRTGSVADFEEHIALHLDIDPEIRRSFAVCAQGETVRNRLVTVTIHGRLRHFLVSCVPLGSGGKTSWLTFTWHDITVRRETEVQRDDFLRRVLHAIRTPVTVIRGFSEYLAQTGTADAGALMALRQESRRIAQFVTRFADALRVESGELILERSYCDLLELAAQAAKEVMERTGRTVTVGGDSVIGLWDARRLATVIEDLIENSVVRDMHGSIDVLVGKRQGRTCVRVRDGGMGMSAQQYRRLFEDFSNASVPHGDEGLGIGLFLANAIVERHGGTLEVKTSGYGTEFLLEFQEGN